ncbi:MAG TPA: hypothetical protein VN805_07905 [Caulobacteraceae bacterium]|nr:hypothetical protein [Caulobacteraceae bacterium]
MLTRAAAQALVDGFSAAALTASVVVLVRRGGASPLARRLGFAFGAAVLFFGVRAAAEALDSDELELVTLIIVSTLPVAALVLAEGVLRRHAPRAMKIAVTFGAAAIAIALLATLGRQPVSSWGLGGYVILSLVGVTVLLLARDRSSLSGQENAGVDGLIVSGALLTVLSVTDFLGRAPVGLSGIGAAGVAFVLGANPTSAGERRRVLIDFAVVTLTAVVAAIVLAGPLALTTVQDQTRLGAVLLALLLAAGAIVAARHRGLRAGSESLGAALAAADVSSLDAFLGGVAEQPLLAGLRIAHGPLLAEYDGPRLATAMAARAVWTRAALAHAPLPDRARDELADLLETTEATHALMVSATPLRIALLTLPGAGPSDDAETALALFGKLAAIAAATAP